MNEEMLKNSADAVEENNSHIKFQKRLNELISEKYIIKNLALLSSDDHVKDLYLKFLCSILLIKGGASDDQVVFIDKLIKGSECKDSIEKFFKWAVELSEQDVDEFCTVLRHNALRYYFALDSMILINLAEHSDPELEYTAQLFELIYLSKYQINYLGLLAKSVVTQNDEYYHQAKVALSNYNFDLMDLDIYPYVKDFYHGEIDGKTRRILCAPELSDGRNIQFGAYYTENEVIFRNQIITIKDKGLKFRGCQKIIFDNCNVIQDNNSYLGDACLVFNDVEKISFNNSSFTGFCKGIADIRGTIELICNTCTFLNCGSRTSGSPSAVFSISNLHDAALIRLENNSLNKCSSYDFYRREHGTFLDYSGDQRIYELDIKNNNFINCGGKYKPMFNKNLREQAEKYTESGNKFSGECGTLFPEN